MADKPAAWPRLGDDPSKIGPPVWLSLEDAFQRLCKRPGLISKDALDDLYALLLSGPSAWRHVDSNGKVTGDRLNAEFWEDLAYPSLETDANDVDHIAVVRPPDYVHSPLSDGRIEFFVSAADIGELCPYLTTVASPKSPATPKKPPRKPRLRPRRHAEEAIQVIWPNGVPAHLDNDPICAEVDNWLQANCRPHQSDSTILRAAGRKE